MSSELFQAKQRAELLDFYAQVFGWRENPDLAIPGERIFLRAPSDAQYITIRSAESPMSTSGYEHLGVAIDSESELRAIHGRAAQLSDRFPELELGPIETAYAGRLLGFRLRFRLPLTLEVQYLSRRPATSDRAARPPRAPDPRRPGSRGRSTR